MNNMKDATEQRAMQEMSYIQRKAAEKKFDHDAKLDLEIQKVYLDDAKRELRRKQYSELLMNSEGAFVAVTRNLLIPAEKRMAMNLREPVLERCESYGGQKGIYKLTVSVNQIVQEVFLNQRNCGREKYLLEKISAIGGVVYGKKSQVDDYIRQFWQYCLTHCASDNLVYYPEEYGWNLTENGKVVFAKEEETLWKDLLNMTK